MKKILVTGGTVFVSRCIAEYFSAKGWDVSVLNRNTRAQPAGVTLIEADRHNLGRCLKNHHFDMVVDTGYTADDVEHLLEALGSYEDYVLISSSAVYPDHAPQPFTEDTPVGANRFWGSYGTNKIQAEDALLRRNPNAYILRPAYLYGPMNNVYREAFVFDCALAGRAFYLPRDGEMKLQFFHIHDLCRLIDILSSRKPEQHILNVGNREAVSIRKWAELCYQAAGKQPAFANVYGKIEQRNYFSFYDYEYYLDVSPLYQLLTVTTPLDQGLSESLSWYLRNPDKVNRKGYMAYIDHTLHTI